MQQCRCGKHIDNDVVGKYIAFDLQKEKKKILFCSSRCRRQWVRMKKFGMWGTLILGVILAVVFIVEDNSVLALPMLFLPYMIRQASYSLKDTVKSGVFGEFFSFAIVVLGTLTVFFPAYRFYQEFIQYRKIEKEDLRYILEAE